MARRALDTTRPLYRLTVSLPTDWQPYLDQLGEGSHAAAVRKLVAYALNNGALAALGYQPPAPTDPEALYQIALNNALADGSPLPPKPRTAAEVWDGWDTPPQSGDER